MNKVLFFVLVVFQVNAQDTIVFPKIDLFKRNIIEVSYGIPLGQLSNKYENSINTGLYFRTKIAKRQFIDFGIELSGIIKGSDVEYNVDGEKVLIDGSKSSFSLVAHRIQLVAIVLCYFLDFPDPIHQFSRSK